MSLELYIVIDEAQPFLESPGCSNRSEREVRGAGLVLQTVWGYKELRRTLEKDGWKKTDFVVNPNPPTNHPRTNGRYEESTLPLIDKGQDTKVWSTARHLCVVLLCLSI